MLKDTVDGEFTTVEDVAEAALFFAPSIQRADRPVAGREPRLVHAVMLCPFRTSRTDNKLGIGSWAARRPIVRCVGSGDRLEFGGSR